MTTNEVNSMSKFSGRKFVLTDYAANGESSVAFIACDTPTGVSLINSRHSSSVCWFSLKRFEDLMRWGEIAEVTK